MECTLHSIERDRSNERKTTAVILITASMMIAEIISGVIFGSMSLLADGVHMGTHAAALVITLVAYRVARIHQHNRNFTFGTGKVGVLGGYTSALILLAAAFGMIWESGERLLHPVQIQFESALVVAVIGLIVNLISAVLLGHDHSHDHQDHDHSHDHQDHDHSHDHQEHDHSHDHQDHDHSHEHQDHDHSHEHPNKHEDHNLRAAYLHVLADAVTSIAAIIALLLGRAFNAVWLDPIVAVAGSIMIFRWAIGLLRNTGEVLLDYTPAEPVRSKVESIVAEFGRELKDFHLWKIDASQLGLIVTVHGTGGTDAELREKIMKSLPVVHCTIECK